MNYNEFNEIDFTNITDDNYNNNYDNSNKFVLYNPYEGYIKGNLFKNSYETYKNLKPININISSEKDEMLLNVNQLSFAKHELNLLLDNYPNNSEIINLFNKYLKMENIAIDNYERRYGPLNISDKYLDKTPFRWVKDKWPWE